jgi:hypothetical protein
MSCPCDGTEFAPLSDTWTPKSSLREVPLKSSDKPWQPYPELLGKKENYGEDSSAYSLNRCNLPAGPPSLTNQIVSNNTPSKLKEKYDQPCCRPNSYMGMNNTWSMQKPYTL